LHRMFQWLDHNRWLVISLVIFAVVLGGAVSVVGCKSTTAGLIEGVDGTPPVQVDRVEFNRQAATVEKDLAIRRVELDGQIAVFNEEVAAFNSRVESGLEDLDEQDEFRSEILNTIGLVATQAAEGSLNPISLIPLGIGLLGGALGLGISADNRRKDRVITDLKKTTVSAHPGT